MDCDIEKAQEKCRRSKKGRREMFEIRQTVQRVAEKSRLVRISMEAVAAFAEQLSSQKFRIPAWDSDHHFGGRDEETVAYLLVLV